MLLALLLSQCGLYVEAVSVDSGTVSAVSLYVSQTARAAAFVAPYVAASTWSEAPVFTSGTNGTGTILMGMQYGYAPGPEVLVVGYNERDAGSILEVGIRRGDGSVTIVAHVDLTGGVVGAIGGLSDAPAFRDGSGIPGHTALTVADGLYLPIEGQLPSNYVGRHGAVTLRNHYPMDGGYLVEVGNPAAEGTTDKRWLLNHQGGMLQLGGFCLSQFDACPGAADDGTLMFDKCTGRWNQCASSGWTPLVLLGDP